MSRRLHFFTLMELIIAITVFLMVAIALFTFSSTVTDNWRRLSIERNRFNELMAMDRAIDSLLTQAIPFMWVDKSDGVSESVPFIVAGQDSLRIASIHRLNDVQEGALRFSEIYLEDGELRVTYTDRPFYDWSEISEERKTTSVLSTDVAAIEFHYADWDSDVSLEWRERLFWRDEWETDDSERKDIPLAIQLIVYWNDGRVESWIRRTTGNSYRERYGTYSLPTDNSP